MVSCQSGPFPISERVAQGLPCHRDHTHVQQGLQGFQQGWHASVAVHIGKIIATGGFAVDQQWRTRGSFVEVVEVELQPKPAGDGRQMHDRVCHPEMAASTVTALRNAPSVII